MSAAANGRERRRAAGGDLACLGHQLNVDIHLSVLAKSVCAAANLRVASPVPVNLAGLRVVAFEGSAVRPVDAFDAAVRVALRPRGGCNAPRVGGPIAVASPASARARGFAASCDACVCHSRMWRRRTQRDDDDVTVAGSEKSLGRLLQRRTAPPVLVCGEGDESMIPRYRSCAAHVDLSLCTGLTTLPDGFAFGAKLRHVVLPASVTAVGTSAFRRAPNLQELDLSHCMKLTAVPEGLVRDCCLVRRVSLPPSITTIGLFAFCSASALEELDLARCTQLTEIGQNFASFCKALRRVAFPPSVTSIGDGAFWGAGLTELDVSHCAALTRLPQFFVTGCASLRSVALPPGVTEIGRHAFSDAPRLEELELAHCVGLQAIPDGLCGGCTALRRVTVPPGVASVGTGAFRNARSLEQLDLSQCTELTSVADDFVQGCSAQLNVTLPPKSNDAAAAAATTR